ncbi:unnamed protein product [Periconia digitata]|uniref:Uncharacterized protein n=1 Tax=Periconia digitata TaxID=1303443 RepID=A0A9W4XJS3_9PLEO|nr:unnamed protein product [Periconia digitata]
MGVCMMSMPLIILFFCFFLQGGGFSSSLFFFFFLSCMYHLFNCLLCLFTFFSSIYPFVTW